jgi:hypothetical protein
MEEKQLKQSEEIDLLYFLRPVSNAGRSVGRGVQNYFRILANNKFIFFLIVFLITALAFSVRFVMPPAFRTEGIFVSHTLPAKYCGMMVKNLSELTGKANLPILAEQLKIAPEVADDITLIQLFPMADTFALEKRDSVLALFRLSVIVKKMDNLEAIQGGIITYLENSEYAKKRKEARIRSLEATRDNLRVKVKSLDSLKEIVNSSIVPRSNGQGIILGEPINPVSIYQAEMSYYQEEMRINESLATIDNIEIVQPFLRRIQPNYPRFNTYLIVGFLISVAAALLITPIIGRKRRRAS